MKKVFSLAALLFLLAIPACGNHEGSTCTKNDDCGGGFVCQSIAGRSADYCCPTPPESSSEQNCHAAVK